VHAAFKVVDRWPITREVGLQDLFRRLRGAPPALPQPARRQDTDSRVAVLEAERPVDRARTPAASPAEPSVSTEAWLRSSLGEALRELDSQTTGDERTPSFLTLLGQIAGNPEGQLRRPPAAAQRAMTACRREDVPTEALVTLLENDPALSQAILARANSAYYSRGGAPCLVLSDAILRQGRQSVHSVLLEQTLGSLVFAGSDRWRQTVEQVWSHMIRTAPIARAVAPAFRVDREQAFALGLLHDVGKLAIFDRMSTLRTAQRSEFMLTPATVSRVLRLLHEPLGGLCVLGWRLGDDAASAIATHHRRPVPEILDVATEVVWLAERIDLAQIHGQPIDLPALWHEGSLTGDRTAAEALLA
jgi:HD-like signal output (HDOD) protein